MPNIDILIVLVNNNQVNMIIIAYNKFNKNSFIIVLIVYWNGENTPLAMKRNYPQWKHTAQFKEYISISYI